MKPDPWQTKMILVLVAWCLIQTVWNCFQAYQIQDLLGMVKELRR